MAKLGEMQKFSIEDKYTYFAGGRAIDREQALAILRNNNDLCRRAKEGTISEKDFIAGAVCVSYRNNETGDMSLSFADLETFEKFDPMRDIVVNYSGLGIAMENALLDALLYLLRLDEHQWNKGTTQWSWYPADLSYYTEMDGRHIACELKGLRDKISEAIEQEIREYEEMDALANLVSQCENIFGLKPRGELFPENRKDYDDNGARANLLRMISNAHKFLIETYRFITKNCNCAVYDLDYCDKVSFREISTKLFILADEAQSCFDELSRAFTDAMKDVPEKTDTRLREEEVERCLTEAEVGINEE